MTGKALRAKYGEQWTGPARRKLFREQGFNGLIQVPDVGASQRSKRLTRSANSSPAQGLRLVTVRLALRRVRHA